MLEYPSRIIPEIDILWKFEHGLFLAGFENYTLYTPLSP